VNWRKAVSRLDRVYRKIPVLDCARQCHGSCGPIPCTDLELERMRRLAGDRGSMLAPECPYLNRASRMCDCYGARPIVCRLFGVVHEMACPHGCMPDRWLTDLEARALLCDVESLSIAWKHGIAPEDTRQHQGKRRKRAETTNQRTGV